MNATIFNSEEQAIVKKQGFKPRGLLRLVPANADRFKSRTLTFKRELLLQT